MGILLKSLYRTTMLILFASALFHPQAGDCSIESAKAALDGGGSAGSAAQTALPDLFTGAMSYQIPIEVPLGRNGMQGW